MKKSPRRAVTPRDSSQALPARSSGTPSYRQPPLDEVVCGIRFEPLAKFKIPHAGLLWSKFKAKYPNIEQVAPIPAGDTLVVDATTGAPIPRLWFISATDDELIQFQLDQLYFNWRRRDRDYPRFPEIFEKFEETKRALDELLIEIRHDPIVLLEHELTYINRIPKEHGWNSISDMSQVLNCVNWDRSSTKLLVEPKNFSWSARFDLPESQGTLDVRLGHARRRQNNEPIVMLQLTAKGRPGAAAWDSSREWFRLAHDWIVNGFADITTERIQREIWGRQDVAGR